MRRSALALLLAACAACAQAAPPSVYLEELTSTELRDALRSHELATAIIPVGGTEQSGPHLVLGKHNVRVRVLAGRIAAQLGNAVVAPVVAYVPEGRVDPPTSHMRFAGTLSIPPEAFEALLAGAARSLRQHGFRDIVLLGDHGGYQDELRAVAARLNREWAGTPARAQYVAAYYRATETTYVEALRAHGLTPAQIGSHAGAADTALALAVDPALVKSDRLPRDSSAGALPGVTGDPRVATAALGQLGIDAIVAQSVAAIRQATAAPR
ncbi:MAG TPA: creatininase family protein [Ideonella sp.]|nr:creatininase family protein [Ideonella sp.]